MLLSDQINEFFLIVQRFGRSGKRRQWIKSADDLQQLRLLAWAGLMDNLDGLESTDIARSICQNAFRQLQRFRQSYSCSCRCGQVVADYWEVREVLSEGYTLADVVSAGLLCPSCSTRPRLPWRATQYVDALDLRGARDAADVVDSYPAQSSRWRGEYHDSHDLIDDLGDDLPALGDLDKLMSIYSRIVRRRSVSAADLIESRDNSGALVFASCGL